MSTKPKPFTGASIFYITIAVVVGLIFIAIALASKSDSNDGSNDRTHEQRNGLPRSRRRRRQRQGLSRESETGAQTQSNQSLRTGNRRAGELNQRTSMNRNNISFSQSSSSFLHSPITTRQDRRGQSVLSGDWSGSTLSRKSDTARYSVRTQPTRPHQNPVHSDTRRRRSSDSQPSHSNSHLRNTAQIETRTTSSTKSKILNIAIFTTKKADSQITSSFVNMLKGYANSLKRQRDFQIDIQFFPFTEKIPNNWTQISTKLKRMGIPLGDESKNTTNHVIVFTENEEVENCNPTKWRKNNGPIDDWKNSDLQKFKKSCNTHLTIAMGIKNDIDLKNCQLGARTRDHAGHILLFFFHKKGREIDVDNTYPNMDLFLKFFFQPVATHTSLRRKLRNGND